MERDGAVISSEAGKAGAGPRAGRSAKRFSWWLGLGLCLGSAGLTFTALYFLVVPRLGAPVKLKPEFQNSYQAAHASVHGSATLKRVDYDQIEASWVVTNDQGRDWRLGDIWCMAESGGLSAIYLRKAVPLGGQATITTILPASAPADAAWQIQGPRGPIPGGRLTLGGPPGMTVGEWEENLLRVGKNYPEVR